MPSTKEYLDYILDQLSGLDAVTYRAMMGEYILYYRGRIFGGIYDDRLLIKDVPAARELMDRVCPELPYQGGSPMLLSEEADDREKLCALVEGIYSQLPETKTRRKKHE